MRPALRAAVILAVVAGGCAAFRAIGWAADFPWSDDWTESLLKLALWVAPCAVALRLWGARGYREVAQALGLTGVAARGYGFGLAASLPVIIALPFGRTLQAVPLSVLVSTILIGPFAEEVLFRGWAFRQLWQRAGWPPAAALVASAVAFGLAHSPNMIYYFSNPYWVFQDLTFILNAAAAGALFAWIVWRWNSLWPAIGLHTFMNLSWQLLGGAGLAASRGQTYDPNLPNAIRLATVVLAIALTLIFRRGRAT